MNPLVYIITGSVLFGVFLCLFVLGLCKSARLGDTRAPRRPYDREHDNMYFLEEVLREQFKTRP